MDMRYYALAKVDEQVRLVQYVKQPNPHTGPNVVPGSKTGQNRSATLIPVIGDSRCLIYTVQ